MYPKMQTLSALLALVIVWTLLCHHAVTDDSLSEGMTLTVSHAVATKPQQKKKGRKVNKPRPTKLTNTHIQGVDLSMDYPGPSGS